MIGPTIDRLIESIGALSPEQAVHAAAARRLAAVMDGDDAPLYALPGLARELRNAITAMTGAPAAGQGVDLGEFDAMMRGAL